MLNSMSPFSGVCWKRGAVQEEVELKEMTTQYNAKMSDNVAFGGGRGWGGGWVKG